MTNNYILKTDSYKASHFLQTPPGMTHSCSYIEPRADKSNMGISEIVVAGVQPFLKDLEKVRITQANIDETSEVLQGHGEPFNREGWDRIIKEFGGKIPVIIEGLRDGTVIPIGTPILQVYNVEDGFGWLPAYIETQALRAIWYPSTVATISREIKKVIYEFLKKTSDDPDGQIMFKLHDFGARGVSSSESAAIGGCAHLFNFLGTDTVEALMFARKYYNEEMAGFSIPAAEHSTITAWGEENEAAAYENMIDTFGGEGKIFAVVSDSYDIYNAVENIWGGTLKEKVIFNGGTLVIRPDSGDPVEVNLRILEILGEKFGFSVNSKGYKVLPSCVRIIQGDGVDIFSIKLILNSLEINGWSADNIAFGMGGALLQKVNRDTFSWAMKCNAMSVNSGPWIPVQKKPKTDFGKASKAGMINSLDVIYDHYRGSWLNDDLKTVRARCALTK